MRRKDIDWDCGDNNKDGATHEQAQLAVLMDLRDELKLIRRLGECPRIQWAFDTLERIDKKLGPLKKRKRLSR